MTRLRAAGHRAARVLVWGVLTPLTLYFLWDHIEARRLEGELAALRARHEPTTYAELNAGEAAVAPGDDAAPFYAAAAALVRGRWVEDPFRRALGRHRAGHASFSAPPEQALRAREVLQRHAIALEMVDRGARLPACQTPLGNQGLEGAPAYAPLARLCALRTSERAVRGDADGAAASIAAELAMLRAFEHEPTIWSQAIRSGSLYTAAGSVEFVLAFHRPSAALLSELQGAFAAAHRRDRLSRVLHGERIAVLELAMRKGEPLFSATVGRWLLSPWERRWTVESVRTLETARTAIERHDVAAAVDALRALRDPRDFGRSRLAARLVRSAAQASARASAAIVVLALERYDRTHGRRPETLDALVPEYLDSIPVDPWKQALRYRPTEDGYEVYSTGANRTDDGDEYERDREGSWRDVRLRVRRVPIEVPVRTLEEK